MLFLIATNITEPEVVADVLINVQEVCHTHEHQEVISPATPPQTEQSLLRITAETDCPDDITTAEMESSDDITTVDAVCLAGAVANVADSRSL